MQKVLLRRSIERVDQEIDSREKSASESALLLLVPPL
jgi:hypothetical protein